MTPAIAAGKPVPVARPRTLADGLTPPFVGAIPLDVARECLDEIVLIAEDEIVAAMRDLFVYAKLYVEGSGAAATAALLAGKVKAAPGARVISIVSGGNVDPEQALPAIAAAGADTKAGAA
jgi:threonine dehydratase